MHAIRPQRPRTAALAILACLLVLASPAVALARTSRSHRTAACAGAARSSSRHAKRGAASRCAKTKTKAGRSKAVKGPKTRSGAHRGSAREHAKKPGATVVFLTPATCEDESQPTRSADGSYSCEDGSEPACEDGSAPVRLTAGGAPMCRLEPEAGSEAEPAECEGESSQCTSVEWVCEDESSGSSQSCEQGAGEEAAAEPED